MSVSFIAEVQATTGCSQLRKHYIFVHLCTISDIYGYILTVTAKLLHTDLIKTLQYKVSANITIFFDIAITVLYLKPKAHTNIHTGSDGNHDNIATCASSSPTLSILCLLSVSFCFCYVFWSGSFPQTFAEEKLT